jgi:hypothetical protein
MSKDKDEKQLEMTQNYFGKQFSSSRWRWLSHTPAIPLWVCRELCTCVPLKVWIRMLTAVLELAKKADFLYNRTP